MASKNPIKGFVRCHMPDCGAVATVHAVGEHRIITDGTPPKNKRNTGRLYYNCPCCGFQQGKGETFQSYINANMKPTKAEIEPMKPVKRDTVTPSKPPVVPVEAKSPIEPETPPKPSKTRLETAKPYLLALFALIVLFFMLNKKDVPAHG